MSKFQIIGKTKSSKDILTQHLTNLIQGRLITIKDELKAIGKDLGELNEKYQMTDDIFQKKFSQGSLGDDQDFFTWDASINLKNKLIDEEAQLRELL